MTFDTLSLLTPDTILPHQFWDSATQLESEKKLMLAVLAEAVEIYQKYVFARNRHGRALFEEAEEWIFNDDDPWTFSFVRICEALNIDAGYLRSGLMKWKARKSRSRTNQQAA